MTDWVSIQHAIATAGGSRISIADRQPVSGGCINQTFKLGSGKAQAFIKLNDAHKLTMFEAEFNGLQALADTASIRVPTPICYGVAGTQSYLVTEYVEMRPPRSSSAAQFGEKLAAMHLAEVGSQYGWTHDNTIGSTPQINTWEPHWPAFWREHRLRVQLELAAQNGAGNRASSLGAQILDALPTFFSEHTVRPSCLHGDLWRGNWGFDTEGAPVIFDPAVYFGDRETDLAMMELFGTPGSHFFAAYRASYPQETGYSTRRTLYNLYHILNHFNLFGGGYLAQAESMMQQLLSEVKA